MLACDAGHVEIVDLLLRHDASVNKLDRDGRTALMNAVGYDPDRHKEERKLEIIKRLLQAGADPNIRCHDSPGCYGYGPGFTALDVVRRTGWHAAERLLVERHAAFDDAAQQHAAALAAAAGKPGTRYAGLVAIHAVLNRKSFARDEDAWCGE